MRYNVRLQLEYAYQSPVAGARHLVRVMPSTLDAGQRVVASSIVLDPVPVERNDWHDFFGNAVVSAAYREPQARLRITMNARVQVDEQSMALDLSPDRAGLATELADTRSLASGSPHHFMGDSPWIALDGEITDYARAGVAGAETVLDAVRRFGERIHSDFRYDSRSTEVDTPAKDAFALRRGVCQDFSHIMIAGLRGIGIPAGYVSGFLRTIPPPGKRRLAGADAMHAWVRAWCGREVGWVEYDPTNRTFTGDGHITVAVGRDYQDVPPITGVLRTSGKQRTSQSVDVVPIEARRAS